MSFLSRFENKMEDAVEGAANKMFDAPLSAVQITKACEKQMRREKMVSVGRTFAPTLYTVLVSDEDDSRMQGYYLTLAGETQTYLSAKAAEQGMTMECQPLVRFIVDDELKHGKFEVIAEMVSGSIIKQLRDEEMRRYAQLGVGPYAAAQASRAGGVARGSSAAAYAPQQRSGEASFQQAQAAASRAQAQTPQVPVQQASQVPPIPQVSQVAQVPQVPQVPPVSQASYAAGGAADVQAAAPAGEASGAGAGIAGAVAPQAVAGAGAGIAASAIPDIPATIHFNEASSQNAAPMYPYYSQSYCLMNKADGQKYPLNKNTLILGRESRNDIVVADINASRTHAELRLDASGHWTISDLGSTNGTAVNGQPMRVALLNPGDVITIGITNFVFMQV